MNYCLFIDGMTPKPLAEADIQRLFLLAETLPEISEILYHRPLATDQRDPYTDNTGAPDFILQLYFNRLTAAEAALSAQTPLTLWLNRHCSAQGWSHQIMSVTRYLPPRDISAQEVTYMVGYQSDSPAAGDWVAQYLRSHPALLTQLPDVQDARIYLPAGYRGECGTPGNYIQRNKVVFQTEQQLDNALASEIRTALREDFLSLPAIPLRSPHYPMATRRQQFTTEKADSDD